MGKAAARRAVPEVYLALEKLLDGSLHSLPMSQ